MSFRNLIEVELIKPVQVVRETISRLGIADSSKKTLYQTCHVIEMNGKYYVLHFKDIYSLRGNEVNWVDGDLERRNHIAKLLEEWGLLKILNKNDILSSYGLTISEENPFVFKLSYALKSKWTIQEKIDVKKFIQDFNEANQLK